MVFEFPLEMTGKTKKDFTAIDQLEHWKRYKTEWCDDRGNPSCTIYVKEHEWLEVGAWVYKNWDIVLGLSFLPDDGGVYQLAPYEEISKETYEQLVSDTTQIDWNKLIEFEREDNTQGAKEFACVGGSCELV
jgi:ribonucleoside-diphosphate reductase alpha chain